MFLGEYQHSIDTKGRVAMPARFRSKIANGVALVKGVENCLYVFPIEVWEKMAEDLDYLQVSAEQRRLIERRFFGTAYESELDTQGRIIIPAGFRSYASLTKEVAVIGARRRIELWGAAQWNSYQNEIAALDLTGVPLPF